ncbi:unnamed protein product [Dovyalis caffra]|uniref:Bulb-type lectin domain-containing protein n=1 Tax=Dovyalis caffra TaxID=77055 RepID=A0AAV1SRB7_9ROSI|nr:unnamed protein product [Dovyalis caffra]
MAFSYAAFFLLVICIYKPVSSQKNHSNLISLGSSLSTNVRPTSWRSPSRRFAFGFYPQRSGFIVGIWLAGKPDDIITWTANRDDPPVPSNAKLELTIHGKLLLRTYANNGVIEEKLVANIEESASNAVLLDSGNLVLYNEHSDVIWESFNFPTDTILGGQNLHAGGELLSRASTANLSTGRFHLKMQYDGNLVLYPTNTLDTPLDSYWNTETPESAGSHLYVNYSGDLLLLSNTSVRVKTVFDSDSESYSTSIIYRATLEYDGIFRLYSHNFDSKGAYTTSLTHYEPDSQCEVKTFCGLNSYCTMNDDQPYCRCLPGTDFVNPDQIYHGCERNYHEELCKVAEETSLYSITDMEKMTWDDIPYFEKSVSEEDCRRSCLQDCNCAGALYESGDCKKQKFPVKYARRTPDGSSKLFFKVGLKSIDSRNRSTAPALKPPVVLKTSKKTVMLIFVMSVAFTACSSVAIAISGFFISKSRVVKRRMLLRSGNFGLAHELTLRAFSYRELKKATKGFKEELGKGSFGAVYKGTICKGKRVIAVKRLEKLMSEGPDQTRTFTTVRGTRGYLAPEWHKNAPISVKADVYSYGVVLLELVFCRKNIETNVSKPGEVVLSNWAYELLVARELDRLNLGENVDWQNLEKMVMVGIWCIQDEPGLRPSMKCVVMMLEGITDVPVPPRPTAASA